MPVTNPIMARIALMLWFMNSGWISADFDVEGAFLQGRFKNSEELYTEIPDGFKEHYSDDFVFRMNVPLYGTKQTAYCFFKTFMKHVKMMRYQQLLAEPFLYFAWVENVLVILVACADDFMILGPPQQWSKKFRKILRRHLHASRKGNSLNMWVVS